MTLATTTSTAGPYLCNGATVAFAYAWKILDDDEIEVTLISSAGVRTTLTKTTHYTVSGVDNPAGGLVTTVATYATGYEIYLRRKPPFTQTSVFANQGAFNATTIETAFDKLAMQEQYLRDEIDRGAKAPVGEDGHVLPTRDDLKSALLMGDADTGDLVGLSQAAARLLFKGEPGGDGNVAYTLAELKAWPTSGVAVIYNGTVFGWTLGTFTGLADDATIVQSDHEPLTTGAWQAKARMSELRVGDSSFLKAAGFSGAAAVIAQMIPGFRGELQMWPCDTGGVRDAFAGGELTVLADDPRVSGFTDSLAAAFYIDRDGSGNTRSVRIRMIPNGTATPIPIRMDSMGGVNNMQWGVDGKVWTLRELQIGGTIDDPDAASTYGSRLRVGPDAGPDILLDDTYGVNSRYGRIRNLDGSLDFINATAGTIPLKIAWATQTTTAVNLTVTGTMTSPTYTGANASLVTTDTTTRPGDFRNSNAAFTDNVLFLAHSNTTLGSANLAAGYDLNAGTFKFKIKDDGSFESATNSYGAISDERLKFGIRPAPSQWDDVHALSHSMSKFRLLSDPEGPEQIGAVAQHWREFCPGLVYSTPLTHLVRRTVDREVTQELVKTGTVTKTVQQEVETFEPVLGADGQPEERLGIKYSIAAMKMMVAFGEAQDRIVALEARLSRLENAASE